MFARECGSGSSVVLPLLRREKDWNDVLRPVRDFARNLRHSGVLGERLPAVVSGNSGDATGTGTVGDVETPRDSGDVGEVSESGDGEGDAPGKGYCCC